MRDTDKAVSGLLGLLAGGSLLIAGLGCGGSRGATNAGMANVVMTSSPTTASLAPGQTMQFTCSIPWGGTVTWSVQPPTGGTITDNGLFTAGSTPGSYSLVAMWNNDVRYTSIAAITILSPPPPAESSANQVFASGNAQQSTAGTKVNTVVAGENVPAITSTSASGTLVVRHGYWLKGQ